jgi:hypothetical protein
MKQFFLKIGKSEIRNILSVICVCGVFGMLFLMFFKEIPKGNSELIYMSAGQILTLGFGVVIGYNFGSSKNESDAAKNDVTKVESTTKTTD